MIPTSATHLSFWDKFYELNYKMMFPASEGIQNHMYSSEPLEWPFLWRGIAYWVSSTSNVRNFVVKHLYILKILIPSRGEYSYYLLIIAILLQAQIHLLGNKLVWDTATSSMIVYITFLVFYILRRRRKCNDLSEQEWEKFQLIGQVFLLGYLFNYLPYFFVERSLFLHHYLPAFLFKVLLTAALIEHIFNVLQNTLKVHFFAQCFVALVIVWLFAVFYVFKKFLVLSYGTKELTTEEIVELRWKDSWDFIVHKN